MEQFINAQDSPKVHENLLFAQKLCYDLLFPIKRTTYGTAYDHSMRVATSLIHEFKTTDPDIIITALLHDVLEDSDYQPEKIKTVFGYRIYSSVQMLNRKNQKWDKLRTLFPDKNVSRAVQNCSVMKEKSITSLVKSVDKLDNLRDVLLISQSDEKYSRIPYWIVEIKLSILPFTTRYYPEIASVMKNEMASIEAIFLKKINRLFNRYSSRLEEALNLWEKI